VIVFAMRWCSVLIWLGDFNYRIDLSREEIEAAVAAGCVRSARRLPSLLLTSASFSLLAHDTFPYFAYAIKSTHTI
jgi:hypothetical protein